MATLARRSPQRLDAGDPFLDLDRLDEQIGEALDRAFSALWHPRRWSSSFTPPGDIEETEDAYVIELELPGIRREDASVEVGGRRVIVSGERKDRERTGILRRRTRVTGSFRFEAVLPGDIDADGVTASYKDGVLVVRAPKPESERTKVRKIEIK